jgi:hypothetical protein
VSDNATWLSLSRASGTGNGTMTATCTANTSTTTARTAVITFKQNGLTKTIAVTQNKKGSAKEDSSEDAKEQPISFVLETIYPNPVSNELSILLNSNELQEVTMEIRNIEGKQVALHKRTLTVGENRFQLPVMDLTNGFYFLSVFKDEHPAAGAQVLKFEVLK